MKIDFGEFFMGLLLGIVLGIWVCAHALTEQSKDITESCDKQGSFITDHQVYNCSKKP